MPEGKFRLNKKTIGQILMTVDGGKREIAQRIADQIGDEAKIEIYETDREVVGIVVPADSQAKHGVATRAANSVRGS